MSRINVGVVINSVNLTELNFFQKAQIQISIDSSKYFKDICPIFSKHFHYFICVQRERLYLSEELPEGLCGFLAELHQAFPLHCLHHLQQQVRLPLQGQTAVLQQLQGAHREVHHANAHSHIIDMRQGIRMKMKCSKEEFNIGEKARRIRKHKESRQQTSYNFIKFGESIRFTLIQ